MRILWCSYMDDTLSYLSSSLLSSHFQSLLAWPVPALGLAPLPRDLAYFSSIPQSSAANDWNLAIFLVAFSSCSVTSTCACFNLSSSMILFLKSSVNSP